jgi:hypothetical protein
MGMMMSSTLIATYELSMPVTAMVMPAAIVIMTIATNLKKIEFRID